MTHRRLCEEGCKQDRVGSEALLQERRERDCGTPCGKHPRAFGVPHMTPPKLSDPAGHHLGADMERLVTHWPVSVPCGRQLGPVSTV